MESSRPEYWSGGHLFLQGIFLSQGWSPHLLCLWQQADSLPLCNQVGPYIFIVNTNHVYALVWDFCPGLKYFVLTDTFTRPALREGPYYDLGWAVLLPQTQSPAHHSLSHQHARMKQRRMVWCGPGGHTCSLRRPFQEGPLGPSELLLTRWTLVFPEEFQASCSSCFGLRCIKGRLATGLHLSGTQGVGSPSVLRAQVNAN